ncbi:MAG: TIGR04255 family protein [Daejeonella sp.]
MVEKFLRPISSKHSIREAVITLFLSEPITEIPDFKSELAKSLTNEFPAMQDLHEIGIQFKLEKDKAGVQESQPINNNNGFRLLNIFEGKTTGVLQAINDQHRNFISVHTFSYIRWENFFPETVGYLKAIAEIKGELKVKAVSIHYIDEFKWIAESDIDPKIVFNSDSQYISSVLLNPSIRSQTNYLIEKQEGDLKYFEGLGLLLDNKAAKKIEISHNTISEFREPQTLESLLNEDLENFLGIFNSLHKYNKLMLDDILLDEVKTLINMPSVAKN